MRAWQFHPQWSLDAMFLFFALKYQQYDGNLQDYNASALGPAGTSSGPTSTSAIARTMATSPGDTVACGCSSERLTEALYGNAAAHVPALPRREPPRTLGRWFR